MKKIAQNCCLLITILISQSLQAAKITWNNNTGKNYTIVTCSYIAGMEPRGPLEDYLHYDKKTSTAYGTVSFDNGVHAITNFKLNNTEYGPGSFGIQGKAKKLEYKGWTYYDIDVLLEWNQGLVFDINEINGQPVLKLRQYRTSKETKNYPQ